MKVLWLCNIILPKVAAKMGLKASNKEGWLSGACSAAEKGGEFELGVCFPVGKENDGFFLEDGVKYYGFYEDTSAPEIYDPSLEGRLSSIVAKFDPDIVHIFGTEFPHTRAMANVMKEHPERILIGIQGVLDIYKDHYFDGLPERVINRVTFRDLVRKDSLKIQQNKYALRAVNETEALKIAGNVTGRTPFDKEFTSGVNPAAKYHFMNETLRADFYEHALSTGAARPATEVHSIFLSQGNYPIKGAHMMIRALAKLKEKYPDARVYIAGDNVTRHSTLKEKLKLSSYGKYLLELIKEYSLEDSVTFTGSLPVSDYIDRLSKSNVFVCPSSIENSPNSLGEAMMLGVPCVSANVGGVSGIFDDGRDGILYDFSDIDALVKAVSEIFDNPEKAAEYAANASEHAMATHDPASNYTRLTEIYKDIANS